jgi:hypothetical protein
MHLSPSFRRLPMGIFVGEIADSCRDATVAFLNGVPLRWGEKDLAAWLEGPYHTVASLVPRTSLEHGPSTYDGTWSDDAGGTAEQLMRDARAEVLHTLRTFETPDDGVTFAYMAIRRARVTRCGDDTGTLGWAPSSGIRMGLADRVLSLVAVDYLARPSDYEKLLAICSTCERVAFDPAERGRGRCSSHAGSEMRLKACDPAVDEVVTRRTGT